MYEKLFRPGRIRGITTKNRIIMAPLERNYAALDGTVTQRYLDYLETRARGGPGLIVVESMFVDPLGRNHTRQLGIHDDSMIPGLRRLADVVHKAGSLLASQLQFGGRQNSPSVTGRRPVAPSPVPCKYRPDGGQVPRELDCDEIRRLVERFAEAAWRTKKSGFDMVEIHGAHGYIIHQFLSPRTNWRSDAYGGPLTNRMRFPLEVVKAVRAAVGNDFPILYRVSAAEFVEGGLDLEETLLFTRELEAAGVDLIDVSAGVHESMHWVIQPMSFPRGCLAEYAAGIKREVSIPVSVAGRINDPTVAEGILEKGQADFVSLGRALHADPEFLKKASAGSAWEIRKCIGCCSCSDEMYPNIPISCSINPVAGRETELKTVRALTKPTAERRVLIAGGGPAGIQAAITAADMGHEVFLFEKERSLGGQLKWASKAAFKRELAEFLLYLEQQVHARKVYVETGVAATKDLVNDIRPDIVIIATGARPLRPLSVSLPQEGVVDAIDILRGQAVVGGDILILGGGSIGCETAIYITDMGSCKVTIVEPKTEIASGLGRREGWALRNEISSRCDAISVLCETTVEAFTSGKAVLSSNGRYREMPFDWIVCATGMTSDQTLIEDLRSEGWPGLVTLVGDSVMPRGLKHAIQEGYWKVLALLGSSGS